MNLSQLQRILLYLIFFVSGSSSLISEITWNRMLVLIVGNTIAATSMILVAFMGGLALGSYWGGRTFSKRRPSLLPYAVIELCIGVYVLFSPLLFQPLSNLFAVLAPSFDGSTILPLTRFLIAFVSLFAPAFLMGATFPAIIAGTALGSSKERASRTGYLYSINTLGAAMGCLGAGYLLLPRLGAQLTLVCAFLLYLLAAIGSLILNASMKKSNLQQSVLLKEDKSPIPVNSFFILIGLATFIVGLVALSYEVLLTRLVILFFGNQLIVFTLVLTAFLIGTGISALVGTWLHGLIFRTGHLFALIVMVAGVTLVAPPFLLLSLSTTQTPWIAQHQDTIVVIIMLVPTLLIGSLLPIAIKIFQDNLHANTDTAFSAGKLYALNAAGGMLGVGLTNYLLVPFWGAQTVLSAFAMIFLSLGLAVLWTLKKSVLRWSAALLCVILLGIYFINLPHKLESLYTLKLTEYSGNDIDPQLKLHQEGRVATATVIDFPNLEFRDMFLNGVEEASTRFGHVQLFKLLGLLPLLVHESDSPKEALMVAFGAGITAGATVGSDMVSSLDVVDLNPDIEKINDLFKDVNGDVFNNPKFNFIAEDGRNYLLMTQKKYSVIISDSTHPRAYDSWILYTEEFYKNVKEHLTPDGVFAQWVPLSDFSLELYRIMLNTFKRVFPNSTFWNIYGTDQAFLLATPKPFSLDLQRLQEQLDTRPESLQLKKFQLDKAEDIAGFFVMGTEALSKFIGDETRINTDDLPYNQQHSLKNISPLRTQSFDRYQASIVPYLRNADDSDIASISDRQLLARTMYRYFFFQDPAALNEALSIKPDDGNVLFFKGLELKKIRMTSKKLQNEVEELKKQIAILKKEVDESPDESSKHIELARIYMKMNMAGAAEPVMEETLKYAPDSVPANNIMGQIQTMKGNWQEAEKKFLFVLKNKPDNKSVRENLVRIYAETGKFQKAIDLLRDMNVKESGVERPDSELYQHYTTLAGAYFSIKDFKKAEDYLWRSLKIYPNNTLARSFLAQVYFQTERSEEAISQLKEILKINPYNESALKQLIELYKKNGNAEERKVLNNNLNRAMRLRYSM